MFQEQAKDTLKRIVNEKLDAVKKLQDVEKTLSTTEDEFATLRELYDKNTEENTTLAGKQFYKFQGGELDELDELDGSPIFWKMISDF